MNLTLFMDVTLELCPHGSHCKNKVGRLYSSFHSSSAVWSCLTCNSHSVSSLLRQICDQVILFFFLRWNCDLVVLSTVLFLTSSKKRLLCILFVMLLLLNDSLGLVSCVHPNLCRSISCRTFSFQRRSASRGFLGLTV